MEEEDAGALAVEERPAEIVLGSLLILPGHQGRGLGTAVIRDVIGRAERLGLPVALQVLKVNPAIRLYHRLGFATVGETATHFLMRRG